MYNETPEMFGHPYKELRDFFLRYPKRGKLLDLGCGQGRDSLFLSSIGFQVTAVDVSEIGIKQLLSKANEQNLSINGIVADAFDKNFSSRFNVILFDMLMHSFGIEQQNELLGKYSNFLKNEGVFCIVFPDDMNSEHFMNILQSLKGKWNLLDEIIIHDVPTMEGEDTNFTFTMIIVQVKK